MVDWITSLLETRQWLEVFLTSGIVFSILATLITIILILVSRLRNLNRERKKIELQPTIDSILSDVLMNNLTVEEIQNKSNYEKIKSNFSMNILLSSIIKLHQNYAGEYSAKLEKFYIDSDLVKKSVTKLQHKRWEIKCEGISELSQMKIEAMFPQIFELTKSKVNTLRMVALLACINLKGLEALEMLRDYEAPIDDWIQLNLLHSIKQSNLTDVPDFGYFLDAENETMVVFGLRLISMFNQANHHARVQNLYTTTHSESIRTQAKKTSQNFLLNLQF